MHSTDQCRIGNGASQGRRGDGFGLIAELTTRSPLPAVIRHRPSSPLCRPFERYRLTWLSSFRLLLILALSLPWPLVLPAGLSSLELAINRLTHECHPVLVIGENCSNSLECPSRELDGRAFWPALLASHA
jgi:hypothetical protein